MLYFFGFYEKKYFMNLFVSHPAGEAVSYLCFCAVLCCAVCQIHPGRTKTRYEEKKKARERNKQSKRRRKATVPIQNEETKSSFFRPITPSFVSCPVASFSNQMMHARLIVFLLEREVHIDLDYPMFSVSKVQGERDP